ncbi:MAG: 2-isopropylmalate synthase LeuA2 [Brevinema sp.]
MNNTPFFYDITLRDGNQALKKPWNTAEKEIIFNRLLELNVQGIEVGFANASDMDFEACKYLADRAGDKVVISALARAVNSDIIKVADALKNTAKPRIHTFIAMNPLGLEYVLCKPISEVKDIACEAVSYAKSLLPAHGQVQFSVEHFGDCVQNLDDVILALQEIVKAGATVINLPNTVERYRPLVFVDMVKKVKQALPSEVVIAVHCHNDLGMATATTVESFFAGATQLECGLNGLGERAGNTNVYEVAVALSNSGVEVPLNMQSIYETALLTAEMSGVSIWEKSPVIGTDALAHRSGIHQDGVTKTKHLSKGAYRAFNPSLIGRLDSDKIGFTSQSGKTALYEIFNETSYSITLQEAVYLTPFAKTLAEEQGELSHERLIQLYLDKLCAIEGKFSLKHFGETTDDHFTLDFAYNNKDYHLEGSGNGPIDACISMLRQAGFALTLVDYEQHTLQRNKNESAQALTVLNFKEDTKKFTSRAVDTSTIQANVKAIFNALNLLQDKY